MLGELRYEHSAVRLAESVSLHFSHNSPTALDTLAVAYASSGRFGMARQTARRALDLARANDDEQLAAGIEQRLALFRSAQPYRER